MWHILVCVVQYTQYLESHSVDEARAVLKRACEIHLTYKPNIHMQWATFEERHGTAQREHTPADCSNTALVFLLFFEW